MCGLDNKHLASDIAIYKNQPSFCLDLFIQQLALEIKAVEHIVFTDPTSSLVCWQVTTLIFYVLRDILPRYQSNSSIGQSASRTHPQQTLESVSEYFSGNSQELVSISISVSMVFLNLFRFFP